MKTNQTIPIQDIKSAVEEVLAGQYIFAVLLGSAGTERFNFESDIDLAIYFNENPEFKKMSKWNFELSERFDRDCDLVSINRIDPIYARQILETGRDLSVLDQGFYNVWKAEQMSLYPDFKESRKIIEDQFLNRKKYV